jgi:hypothetical protein
MRPIASEWGARSRSADGREEFWRWRRARSLPEFIPAAPAVRRAMVRGWFTAFLLGQVELNDLHVKIFIPNLVGGNGQWESFPEPLLAAGITAQHDYLPLVLESLPLAFVDVALEARLTPMLPYRRLRDIGTSGEGGFEAYQKPNRELRNWIENGELPQGAPVPNPLYAGAAESDWQTRRSCIVDRVAKLVGAYTDLFREQEKRSESAVAKAYELEADILAALNDLAHTVREHDVVSTGADAWN